MPASNENNQEENRFWVKLPPFTGSMTLIGVILISIMATAACALTGVFYIKSTGEKLNKEFIQTHKELLFTLGETAEKAAKNRKYAGLIRAMQKIKGHQEQAGHSSSIQDIFYLKRNGEVAAHTDITQLTINAKSNISKVNSIYNNESFHHSLLGDRGVVYTLAYPYDSYNTHGAYLYLFKKVLPENFFSAIDFAMPVYSGKKSAGTLHIIATRPAINALMKSYLQTLSFIWMGSLLGGFLIMLTLHVYVAAKVNEYEKILTAIEIPAAKERHMEDEIRLIEQKLSALGTLSGTFQAPAKEKREIPKPNRIIKDAILIKSE